MIQGSNDVVIIGHYQSLSSAHTTFCPHKHRKSWRKHRSNIVTLSGNAKGGNESAEISVKPA